MSLYNLNNYEIKSGKKIIIPLGSMEQHGPHLPISTDTIIAEYLANQIYKKNILVCPSWYSLWSIISNTDHFSIFR